MEEEKKLPEDEEIIELTDEVSAAPESEEEIIELTDMVDEPAAQEPEISAGDDLTMEEITEPQETVETPGGEDQTDQPVAEASLDDIQFGEDLDEEIDSEEDMDDDFVNALGMDLEEDDVEETDQEDLESPLTGAVTPDQIEAAIERVLMKILPDKIESIMVEAIEKTVANEINKIKGALLDD